MKSEWMNSWVFAERLSLSLFKQGVCCDWPDDLVRGMIFMDRERQRCELEASKIE